MGGDSKTMSVTKISTDMVKPFSGDGDVVAWLQKVELVAKLTKVEDLASFIPLYLEGGALAVYMEMSSVEQGSADHIKKRLKQAFCDSVFAAYSKLLSVRWSGEAVDVYANELRRLAGLAGFEGDALEHIVKLSFIHGFPDDIGVELQQVNEVETKQVTMSALLTRARVLASNRSLGIGAVAVHVEQSAGTRSANQGTKGVQGQGRTFSGKCFRCGGPHMIRECPERSTNERKIICYNCSEEGHIAPKCPNRSAGSNKKSEN